MSDESRSTRTALTWSSAQAYVLAVFCLVLGVALGYLFRGSASPAAASDQRTVTGAPAGTDQQFDPEQHKAMVEQVVTPLLDALKKNPNDFDTIVKIGNLYYDAKQYKVAIPYYDRALKIQPENSDVRTDLGTAYWYLGDADRAIAEFTKSLQFKPDHAATLFNLGVVRWQGKSDPKGAVQAWEELLKKNPNYPQKQQIQDFIDRAKQHAKG
jgi:cytochrome c-type biogenesis protein CcmH/NrfG